MVASTKEQARSDDGTLAPELGPLHAGDPESLGVLQIIGRLGSGGLGVVYGAVDSERRCLAVQTVSPQYAADARFREVFAREVGLLRQVSGVCVPQVRDADPVGETLWVAADHVAGRPLDRHLHELGPLEGVALLAFAAGCAEALASMHAAGIVHHDITPTKVILSPDGPRIVDVGTAPRAGEHQDDDPSGTPGWLPPERYRGAPVESSGDVFAWGALVVLAATGRTAFGEGGPSALRERALHDEPEIEGVPHELRELVAAALCKDPASRPTAEEALRAILTTATGEAPEAMESRTAQRGLLRGYLALNWQGTDAAGHNPEVWAALAGLPIREASEEEPRTAPMPATPGGGGTVPAPPGRSPAPAAGRRPRRAGIALGAAAGVAAAAVLGVGGYVAFDSLAGSSAQESAPEPGAGAQGPDSETLAAREAILEAADAVLEAETFEAETLREHLNEPTVVTAGHQYFTEPEPAYLHAVEGEGDLLGFVGTAGEVFEYSEDDGEWTRGPDPEPWQDFPGQDPFSREGLVEPLRQMAEAEEISVLTEEEVEGVHTVVYTGTVEVLGEGQGETESSEFQVRIDDSGLPVRHYYARGDWEIRTTYEVVGGAVEPDFPWDELPEDREDID